MKKRSQRKTCKNGFHLSRKTHFNLVLYWIFSIMVRLPCYPNLPHRAKHPLVFRHYLLMPSRGRGWEERVVEGGHLPAAVKICQLANEASWFVSNFQNKQKKKSELPSGKWEEDTTWQKCFRKHRKTQKHTQILQCVHTHTRTERQCPQTDKTGKLSLLLRLSFPNYLTFKGSWETSSRESAGDRKTGFCW